MTIKILKNWVGLEKLIPDKNMQLIDLAFVDKEYSNSKSQVKNRLFELFENLQSTLIDEKTFPQINWKAHEENAVQLGLEQLSFWFTGLQDFKEKSLAQIELNFDLVQVQLDKLIDELRDAIQCLDEFDYFLDDVNGSNIRHLEGKRVLLVEDMAYNRILLKKILEKQKCQIIEAENGKVAIETWKENDPFDLIIMDMNMPVMDGFEATKTIRKYETEHSVEKTPIIALTALAMKGDKERCLSAGVDGYLAKPVNAKALISTSDQILTGRSALEEDKGHEALEIKRVYLKSNNQIIIFSLRKLFYDLKIEFEYTNEEQTIIDCFSEDKSDLVILEAADDIQLAYYLKSIYPQKFIVLIATPLNGEDSLIRKKAAHSMIYPFDRKKTIFELEYFSKKILQAKQKEETLADAVSLSKIKDQTNINEAIQNSNGQIAVWQKAFRKIGGDLILSRLFNMHGKFGFVLGDVAGHDIQSGYTASWFLGLLNGVWRQNSAPHHLLRYLNNFFDHSSEEEDKRFVCALSLLWDPLRQKLSYANAAIPGGILVRKETGKAELIKWTGIPIGMFPDMDMFDHDEIDFCPGDRLYIATDGVLEAIPSEIISGISETTSNQSAEQALESIVDFVSRSIEITDDLTIVVFEAKVPLVPENGFRLTINSSIDRIEEVIKQIESYCFENEISDIDISKVSMATREALSNAVEHGNQQKDHLPVYIDLDVQDKSLHIKISDCGSGFDLSNEKNRLEEEGELRIHGRGIEIMENVCKSIQYIDGGVHMEFSRGI